MVRHPIMGQGILIVEASRSHSDTPHSVRIIWTSVATQKPLTGNTQHSQQTDIHAVSGIRTRNTIKRAVADPRLRPRGHLDLQ